MRCFQCQYENASDAKFCNQCGVPFAPRCPSCGYENAADAKFCNQCSAPLMALASAPGSVQSMHQEVESERRFQTLLLALMQVLQRERRVTYRTLKHTFGVDDAVLAEICEELRLRCLAIDEEGKVLVWTDDAQPPVFPTRAAPSRSAILEDTPLPSSAAPAPTALISTPVARSKGPTISTETLATDVPHEDPITALEPDRRAPDAERRQLTVMFCDLADSTKLSQQLDPEDLREVIRAYQDTAAVVIHQYEGHIAQYLGDGLLIYFGWPRAHEDDVQRALHSGLGIVEAITTTLNPRLEGDKGVRLAVRIGIHTGPVVVGEMGGGERHESLALGETPNIAARLEGLAAPNTVVISPVTARLVQRAFVLEELGAREIKGVTEPMVIARVVSSRDAALETTEWAGQSFESLVGRDEEIGLLRRRWEQSKAGLGQVVLISGEAGIGKSSLIKGIRNQARQEGLTRIAFRCSPYATNSALYPIIKHIERTLNWLPDDTTDLKLEKLEHGLASTSLVLGEAVPLLASLLSLQIPEGRYAVLPPNPQLVRQQTHDMLVTWLLGEAERQPVVAVWEDLHWADPSTLEVLGLMIDQAPTASILHVLTYRPEFEPSWSMRSHMTPILLHRLERPQVEALITRLARGKALSEEVVEHIVAKTDGVPLYVEELTKMLLASGLLHEAEDHYVLTGPLASVAIPDTLQDSLMARLDQMNTAKEIAQLGAVIGREFSYEMIQAISPRDNQTLQASLTQLVAAELLYQRGRPPRARYLFKHALIQDAAYVSLLRHTRQRYHQQIAEHMTAAWPELVEAQPELVARHFTEAGCPEAAITYWHMAGRRAIERSAFAEAIAHFTDALEVLSDLPETSERMRQELSLQVAIGPALIATRGAAAPEVEQTYTQIETLAEQLQETPPGLWLFYYMRGEIETARAHGTRLMDLAQRVQDPSLLFDAHLVLGTTLFRLGEVVQARAHLEQGSGLYDPKQHHAQTFLYAVDPGVFPLCYAARVLWLLGYPDQALDRSREAFELAHELSHPFSQVYVLTWTTVLHQLRRDWPAVQQLSEEVITRATEYGFSFLAEAAVFSQGRALVEQGEADQGIARMVRSLAGPRAAGMDQGLPYSLGLLADAYTRNDRIEEGLEILNEALAVARRAGGRYWEAELHRLKGELWRRQSPRDTTEAESCLNRALDTARRQQAKSWELRVAMSVSRLWQRQGRQDDAGQLLAEVYGWFTEGFDTTDLQEARALLEELRGG